METTRFAQYELSSDILSICERTKKGTFKPCIQTIPYSTITGSLRNRFNISDMHAVGVFHKSHLDRIAEFKGFHIYSPRSVFEDVAKVPLRIESLTSVRASVYILLHNEELGRWCEDNQTFNVTMGRSDRRVSADVNSVSRESSKTLGWL
jgi:hypothetical protein